MIPLRVLRVALERTRLSTVRQRRLTATSAKPDILPKQDKLARSANPGRIRIKQNKTSVSFAQRVHFSLRRALPQNLSARSARLEHLLWMREALSARRALQVHTAKSPAQLSVHYAR
jgi:hypothetical protein